MVIIGLLAGYVGPKFFGQIGKSEVKAAKAQIDALQKALDQYRLDVAATPAPSRAWPCWSPSRPTSPWAGPYLSKAVPKDPGATTTSTAAPASTASTTC
jgi:general secretion pathway protein G